MYSAWDEIHDVFGDGTDFDWALDAQAEAADADFEDETRKNLRLEDVSHGCKVGEMQAYTNSSRRYLTQQRSRNVDYRTRTEFSLSETDPNDINS